MGTNVKFVLNKSWEESKRKKNCNSKTPLYDMPFGRKSPTKTRKFAKSAETRNFAKQIEICIKSKVVQNCKSIKIGKIFFFLKPPFPKRTSQVPQYSPFSLPGVTARGRSPRAVEPGKDYFGIRTFYRGNFYSPLMIISPGEAGDGLSLSNLISERAKVLV